MKKIIAANLISGLSLTFLIVFGANYLIFRNTVPYQNLVMEIINNPITGNEDLHFSMSGTKVLECIVSKAYGIAQDDDGNKVYLTDFTEQYFRNTPVGKDARNSWKMRKPEELHRGVWRVDIIGNWTCKFWIFNETRTRSYDNILLIVE